MWISVVRLQQPLSI
uniref:Uncharacterized protein n=1 Tax=Anguilla anguilla TaxID=7936 RepID=A0A0E9VG98_ANGAN